MRCRDGGACCSYKEDELEVTAAGIVALRLLSGKVVMASGGVQYFWAAFEQNR
jgi:hypothetical protein